jgi:hypothetical protein
MDQFYRPGVFDESVVGNTSPKDFKNLGSGYNWTDQQNVSVVSYIGLTITALDYLVLSVSHTNQQLRPTPIIPLTGLPSVWVYDYVFFRQQNR